MEAAKYNWPDCAPDTEHSINLGLNVNGIQYKKVEIESGRWQWHVDEAAMEAVERMKKHRRDLYWALRSRVLTLDEMAEVERYGEHLVIECGVSYNELDKKRELNDALLQQFKLRLAGEGAKAVKP